jgi:hypothetical protein
VQQSTVAAVYATQMRNYIIQLCSVEHTAGSDHIATPIKQRGLLGFTFSKAPTNNANMFTLWDSLQLSDAQKLMRVDAVDQRTQSPVIPYIAIKSKQLYTYEFLFRSMVQLLRDTVSNERDFGNWFFVHSPSQERFIPDSIFISLSQLITVTCARFPFR